MDLDHFISLHPKLYHMAEATSWDGIRENGLLSTEALLDLFEIAGESKEKILSRHRPHSVVITHKKYGRAVIRDQKPMSDGALSKCLMDGLTPSDWYRILNGKTFFWTTYSRLIRLLNARAYRHSEHCILTVDTRSFLKRNIEKVTLSPYNSGSTIFKPVSRGNETFLPLKKFPYDGWLSKRAPQDICVELAVKYSVDDILDSLDSAKIMKCSDVLKILYP